MACKLSCGWHNSALSRPVIEADDCSLPEHVREEFEEYLRCGVLEHGFLRVVCEHCHAERLVAFSRKNWDETSVC